MSKHWAGVLAALVTGISWGVVSPVGRILALRGVDMTTAVVLRTLLVVLLVLPWALVMDRRSLRLSPREGAVLFVYAVFAVPMTGACFMFSLKYLTVPAALIIHYTFPLVTLLGDLWITRERPTPLQYLAAALVTAGVWTGVFSGSAADGGFSIPGILWGAMAVVGLSGQFLAGRVLISREHVSGTKLLFYSHLFGALIMTAVKHFLHGWGDVAALDLYDIGLIATMTVFGSILGYGSYCVSLRYVSASTASHICTVEIPSGILIAALMSSEAPTIREIGGSAMIILAILLAAVPGGFVERLLARRNA